MRDISENVNLELRNLHSSFRTKRATFMCKTIWRQIWHEFNVRPICTVCIQTTSRPCTGWVKIPFINFGGVCLKDQPNKSSDTKTLSSRQRTISHRNTNFSLSSNISERRLSSKPRHSDSNITTFIISYLVRRTVRMTRNNDVAKIHIFDLVS